MRRTTFICLSALYCLIHGLQLERPVQAADSYQFQPVTAEPVTAPSSSLPPAAPAPAEISTAPAASANSSTSAVILDDKHRLLAGDRLTFRILEDRMFEEREPKNTMTTQPIYMVTDSGELNVPYIGLVTVAGKTCREAADEIRKLLEKDYYYKATVVLGLDQATKVVGHFTIYGNVKSPGNYELPVNESFTVGRAITRAGGFGDFADKKNVKVIRTVDGQKQTFELNMVDILEKGKIEKDLPVLPDDYISVPQKLINF